MTENVFFKWHFNTLIPIKFLLFFLTAQSPNPDESVYFDAITNGYVPKPSTTDLGIKVTEFIDDNLKINRYKIINDLTTKKLTDVDAVVVVDDDVITGKSKGAISKQYNDEITDSNIIETVLRKNNFNCTTKFDDEIVDVKFDDVVIIKRPELPAVICPIDLQEISLTKNLIENFNDEIPETTTKTGNEVNMRKDSQVSSGSKIPVFNPSLRISKCSSWACGDISPSPEITDLTPGKFCYWIWGL